ncbi:torsin-1A-like [Octopus sinensis]|uniref:Torsin-1A-like n=1 Tax=Octopus sinensis TaxID=2607531 RepID=A0A6P7TQR5_9MOLL|nr:torsin-1A-like [Octopus sinensis]
MAHTQLFSANEITQAIEYSRWLIGMENCHNGWTKANITGLNEFMSSNLFGQPFVHSIVIRSLHNHLLDLTSQKPLVLSFHGPTGTGKNFVAKNIAKYVMGKNKSRFVHTFISTLHFPSQNLIEEYKSQLAAWITGNLTICPYSIFIFDEIERMPPTLLDSVTGFMDYSGVVNNVDYGKAIYLLLSNSGSGFIINRTVELFIQGYSRNSIKFSQIENFKNNPDVTQENLAQRFNMPIGVINSTLKKMQLYGSRRHKQKKNITFKSCTDKIYDHGFRTNVSVITP